MKHISEILGDVVPQRWTAIELTAEINKGPRRVSAKRVSGMLRSAVREQKIFVKRAPENGKMIVWYEGPAECFADIRRRV